MTGADALVAVFADPVLDAQAAFRALLDAMANPGRLVDIAGCPAPPEGLHPAGFAVALTLFDADTPVWLSPRLRTAAVTASLRFHCGCPLADAAVQATFAIVGEGEASGLGRFDPGDERYPDRSATLLVQLPSLEGGPAVTLSGPGIDGAVTVAPAGLDDGFWAEWEANRVRYPLGVDAILVSGTGLMGLPRSAAVRPAEG